MVTNINLYVLTLYFVVIYTWYQFYLFNLERGQKIMTTEFTELDRVALAIWNTLTDDVSRESAKELVENVKRGRHIDNFYLDTDYSYGLPVAGCISYNYRYIE